MAEYYKNSSKNITNLKIIYLHIDYSLIKEYRVYITIIQNKIEI
jgi:hypothetical protein